MLFKYLLTGGQHFLEQQLRGMNKKTIVQKMGEGSHILNITKHYLQNLYSTVTCKAKR